MKPVGHVCSVSGWIKYGTIRPVSYTFIMCLVKQGDSCTLLEVFSCCWVVLLTPKLLWSLGGGIQFKIMLFLSIGTSGKMPFRVMMNENVYIASAHHPWGCQWLLKIKEEEEGWLLSCGRRTAYGREEPAAFISYPDSGRTFLWNTDTTLPYSMESLNKNVRSHKMPEVPLCDASHPQRTLLAKVCYIKLWCMLLVNWTSMYRPVCLQFAKIYIPRITELDACV